MTASPSQDLRPTAPPMAPSTAIELLAASGQGRRLLTGIGLMATALGVVAVLGLQEGGQPRTVVLLWLGYTMFVLALARYTGRRAKLSLTANALVLQAALIATAWMQGWGLEGGSLFFLAPTGMVVAMMLPPHLVAVVVAQACAGVLALAFWHVANGPPLATGAPPLAMKTLLLLAAQALATGLGMVMGRLIGQQMQRETQLMARYRDFFEQVPTGVIVHRRGVVLDANRSAAQMLAFPDPQAMMGISLADAAATPQDAQALLTRVGRLEQMPVGTRLEPVRFRLKSLNGREIDAQTTCCRVTLPDGPANIAMITDETLRLAMEASLRWSLSLQRQLVASSPLAIWVRHLASGRTINCNDAAARLTGYTVAELLGGDALARGRSDEPVNAPWSTSDAWRDLEDAMRRSRRNVEGQLGLRTATGEDRSVRVWATAFTVDQDAYAVWFGQDATRETAERREREALMERARADAEAASRSKSAFLANTSHELRTPLNAIIGLSRLALAPGVSDADRLSHLRQIHDSSQTLADIVSGVLDLSKIEAGHLAVERTLFDLDDLVVRLEGTYRTLAEAKGLRMECRKSWHGEHWVVGDPTRVRQIAQNLLANALKFTQTGFIRLSVRRLGPVNLCIEVLDSGPGVPLEVQELIFEPFAQADSSTTRRHGGTGLGLSIVSELSRLMGGWCDVSSTPPHGARFWSVIELPTAGAPAPAPTPSPQEPDSLPLQGLNMLVVEDNPINRMIVTLMLEQQGARAQTANDGRQAMDLLLAQAERGPLPDGLILDMQMPEMDGKSTAQAVRSHPLLGRLPILALTAGVTPEERAEALASGVDAYLTKPIDLEALTRTLRELIIARRRDLRSAWPPA